MVEIDLCFKKIRYRAKTTRYLDKKIRKRKENLGTCLIIIRKIGCLGVKIAIDRIRIIGIIDLWNMGSRAWWSKNWNSRWSPRWGW